MNTTGQRSIAAMRNGPSGSGAGAPSSGTRAAASSIASGKASSAAHSAQTERPNIIVIIADDMGYSDISPFGGEIPTPNLQAMAEQGMRMSQYYTSPMSAPAPSWARSAF